MAFEPITIDPEKYAHLTPADVSVVAVYWTDITDSLEDYPSAAKCVSWGALLEDGEEFVVLAHGWDPIDGWKGWSMFPTGTVDNIAGANRE